MSREQGLNAWGNDGIVPSTAGKCVSKHISQCELEDRPDNRLGGSVTTRSRAKSVVENGIVHHTLDDAARNNALPSLEAFEQGNCL